LQRRVGDPVETHSEGGVLVHFLDAVAPLIAGQGKTTSIAMSGRARCLAAEGCSHQAIGRQRHPVFRPRFVRTAYLASENESASARPVSEHLYQPSHNRLVGDIGHFLLLEPPIDQLAGLVFLHCSPFFESHWTTKMR
jgi:hypothetical protein